ncbi:MAG: hypothetical protein AABW49_01775 [Nanoarchaeota archaeon]
MKRLAVLIVIMILSACSSIEVDSKAKIIEPQAYDIPEENETIQEEPSLPTDQYKMHEGDKITINDHGLRLININNDGEVLFEVDGIPWVVYASKHKEIYRGIEITIIRINYDSINKKNNYAIVESKKYITPKGQYLLQIDETSNIFGVNFTLTSVEPSEKIMLNVGNNTKNKLKEKESKLIENFNVTNIDAFPRPPRFENYAIIGIQPR